MYILQAHTSANVLDPKSSCVCLDGSQYLFRQEDKGLGFSEDNLTRKNVE